MISDCWQSKRIIYYFIKSVQIITCQRNYFSKLFLLNTILIRHFHPLCCLFMLPDYQGLHDQKKTQTKTQKKTNINNILHFTRVCWDTPVPEVSDSLGNFIFPLCYGLQVTASGTQAGSRRSPPPDTPREVSGAPGGRNCSSHNRMKSIHFSRIKSWHMIFLHMKYTEFQPTWLCNRQFFLIMEIGW